MPRSFFDQVLVTETPRRGSGWMKVASIILHLGIVLAILVLPITAAIELPGVFTSLPPVVLATVSPVPPAPPPQTAPPVVDTAPSIPLEAPDGITEEKEIPIPPAFKAPGGLPGVGSYTGLPMAIGDSTISIADPPAQQPPAPRRVGGDISPPERTAYKAPQYPSVAQSARVEGTVILEAIIDAEGVVQNVKVLKSVPLLDRAAIEAVQQWRYRPTRLNGVAIPVIMSVTVTFTLR